MPDETRPATEPHAPEAPSAAPPRPVDEALPPSAPPGAVEPSPAPVEAAAVVVPPGKKPSMVFLVVVTLVSLVLDLGSKEWATIRLDRPSGTPNGKIEIIKDHLNFVHAENKGGAWGLLQDENEAIRRPFFLLISAAAVIFILSLYRRLTPQQRALKWGLPLVLGGALGNLVDRIRYGHVIDFIDVKVTRTFTWPTFNIADVAICVGVGLMAIDMFTSRKSEPAAVKAAGEPVPAEGLGVAPGDEPVPREDPGPPVSTGAPRGPDEPAPSVKAG